MENQNSGPVARSSDPAIARADDNVVLFPTKAGRARPASVQVAREVAVDLLLRDILGPLYKP